MKWRCCGNTSTNMLRINRQKIESDHGEKKAVMNLKRSHVKMNLNARHLDANFDVTRACVNTSITNLCLLFFFFSTYTRCVRQTKFAEQNTRTCEQNALLVFEKCRKKLTFYEIWKLNACEHVEYDLRILFSFFLNLFILFHESKFLHTPSFAHE